MGRVQLSSIWYAKLKPWGPYFIALKKCWTRVSWIVLASVGGSQPAARPQTKAVVWILPWPQRPATLFTGLNSLPSWARPPSRKMTDGLLRKAATFFVCRSLRGLHGEGAAVPFHQLYDSISWLAKQISAVCDTMMSPFLNLSVSLSSWFMFALQIGFFLLS